jgi:hypothetical protein
MPSRPRHRFPDLAQRWRNAGNELLTGFGQRHASRRSVEQAHAEFRFQRSDGMAQRRARHAEFGSSRSEAAVAHEIRPLFPTRPFTLWRFICHVRHWTRLLTTPTRRGLAI